jgi:uncharacterized HhH-GPD family protein
MVKDAVSGRMFMSSKNLAFKLNWNDAGYEGVCSPEALDYNHSEGRKHCIGMGSDCQSYKGKELTWAYHPCYESIIFSNWRVGAGWDQTEGELIRYRRIKFNQIGKFVLMTTKKPEHTEEERKIIGFFHINDITNNSNEETIIYGSPETSLKLDEENWLDFWGYYRNSDGSKRWGHGLYRYLDDKQLRNYFSDIFKMGTLSDENRLIIEKHLINLGGKDVVLDIVPNKVNEVIQVSNETNVKPTEKISLSRKQEITQDILDYERNRDRGDKRDVDLTPNKEANDLVNEDPLAYLFGVIFDHHVKAELAWGAPYLLKQRLGHLNPQKVVAISDEELEQIFAQKPALHRYYKTMAGNIKDACLQVIERYDGNAENIWNDEPRTDDLQRRFESFNGIGQKKASMATNILVRDFGIPVKDRKGIDVSYDIHIRRVFTRTGLAEDDEYEIINTARQLNPDYPGELDLPCWMIGRVWCRPTNPNCEECPISNSCNKIKIDVRE